MSGIPHPSDDDPLIVAIRALKADVNRWIDAELRARSEPSPTLKAAIPAELPAPAQADDSRGRLDALAARLEGRLRQGGRSGG